MILTTHILLGSLAAKPFLDSNPLIGFFAAIASHYLSDTITHWHYPLSSLNPKKRGLEQELKISRKTLITDLFRVALDLTIGLILMYLVFRPPLTYAASFPLLLAAFGGILPDILHPVYWLWKKSPMLELQKFHLFIHSRNNLDAKPLIGISSQMALNVLAVFLITAI